MVEHVSHCTAVQPAVMALIKPVRDHQADAEYKNTAHCETRLRSKLENCMPTYGCTREDLKER